MWPGETHQQHEKNLFAGFNLQKRSPSQAELDAAAAARGALIQAFENGDRCNPQTKDGRLLTTSVEVMQAMQANNG